MGTFPAWPDPIRERLWCRDGHRVPVTHLLSQHGAAARAPRTPAAPAPLLPTLTPPCRLRVPAGRHSQDLPPIAFSVLVPGGKSRTGSGVPGGRGAGHPQPCTVSRRPRWGVGQSVRLTRAGPALGGPRGRREAAHDHVLCILCCGGGGAPGHSPAPTPFPATQWVPTGGHPVPPPADPRSHGGLCSRERRSATDFFLARAAVLRLSRSRMSRKDRRSDSSLSRSAGTGTGMCHHTPPEEGAGRDAQPWAGLAGGPRRRANRRGGYVP